MVTISVCLIVKNEEKVLARCLDSLAGLYDELIIVDTGSTDTTKQVAGKYTGQVFEFEWVDDFSAARNFAFSKANMEYIYSADADEVIDEENRHKFMQLKQCILPEIEIVQFIYGNQLTHNTTYNYDEELRPKLYKRLREFVWTEPVHEAVRKEPVVFDSEIKIMHLPQNSHGTRDFGLFQRAIRIQGGLSRYLRTMYARELYIAGTDEDFRKSLFYFEQVSKDTSDTADLQEILCVVGHSARVIGDANLFFKAVLKLMALGDAPSEICWEAGMYFEAAGDFEEACVWYYNAAYETKPCLNLQCGTERPLDGLIRCNQHLGNTVQVQKYQEIKSKLAAGK